MLVVDANVLLMIIDDAKVLLDVDANKLLDVDNVLSVVA